MSTRVGKGFSQEKMANLKEFIEKVCKRQHFIHENS